jgi:hypothetical protein
LAEVTSSSGLPTSITGTNFNYIVDNWSKAPENAALFIDVAKKASKC